MKDDLKLIEEDVTNYKIQIFTGDKIICSHCNLAFWIAKEYVGVITCPYCGEYVEGM